MHPPSAPSESDPPRTPDPIIRFSIQQRIWTGKHNVYRAWADPEMFQRWIVSRDDQLDICVVDLDRIVIWKTTSTTADDLQTLQGRTHRPGELLEFEYSTLRDARDPKDGPARMSISFEPHQVSAREKYTLFKLDILYRASTLSGCMSMLDANKFWYNAADRMCALATSKRGHYEGALWTISLASDDKR